MPDDVNVSPPHEELDQDTKDLHAMGYAQELDRSMSGFSNFAVSFTIISILSGCLTLYGYRPPARRPARHALGLAARRRARHLRRPVDGRDLLRLPDRRWSVLLGRQARARRQRPVWSWFTGWFNLLGQVAVTAGISFGCAFSISAFMNIITEQRRRGWSRTSPSVILAVVLFIQGLLNTFSVRLVALLNDVSVYWHLIGVAIIFVLLFWAPSSGSHQTVGFLFGSEGWQAFEGLSGFSIPLYIFLIGLLNAQYTFTGYDASAHVSEETIHARIAAPRGIVRSIWVSLIAGFILLLAVSFAIPHAFPVTINGIEYTGYDSIAVDLVPWATIFIFAAGKAIGLLLILVVIVAQFFCGMSSITANSRMIYAFSRDGAVPFSNYWHHVSKKRPRPRAHRLVRRHRRLHPRAAVPVQHRGVRGGHVHRRHRPLHLLPHAGVPAPHQPAARSSPVRGCSARRGGPIINWIAIIWVVFIVILLMLPQYNTAVPWSADFDVKAFNYAPVAVLVVIGGAGLW